VLVWGGSWQNFNNACKYTPEEEGEIALSIRYEQSGEESREERSTSPLPYSLPHSFNIRNF